jgi:hypothetical protein
MKPACSGAKHVMDEKEFWRLRKNGYGMGMYGMWIPS